MDSPGTNEPAAAAPAGRRGWGRSLRIAGAIVLASLCLLGAYVGHALWTNNFHVVAEGRAFRSGQMTAATLHSRIASHGIKTIVNLRGANPDKPWYQDERRVAAENGVELIDIAMSSSTELDPIALHQIVERVRSARAPLLIHCSGGADRTSLIAAAYLVDAGLQPGAAAVGQLSPWFGHLTWIWPKRRAMDRSFARYLEWRDAGSPVPAPASAPASAVNPTSAPAPAVVPR